MRWKSGLYLKSRQNESRVVRKFLWWPRRFDSGHWRWLEFAYIEEEILRIDVGGSMEWGRYAYAWCETGFSDEKKGAS